MAIFKPAWEHSLLVMRWSGAIPENPEIALFTLAPPSKTIATIRTLAANDALRPRLVSQKLARAINETPNRDATSAGTLDEASLEATGHLAFHGWARVPEQDRPADCVVIGFETSEGRWQPFCVFETSGNRRTWPSILEIGGLTRAGFSGRVASASLPPGDITIKAWAIDLRNERVFPLDGAVRLQVPR